MSISDKTGNPVFDLWLENQQQLLNAQTQWIKPDIYKMPTPFSDFSDNFLNKSLQNWQQCEQQYQSWMKASENWFGVKPEQQGESPQADETAQSQEFTTQALSYMLNPATFMQSGFGVMDQAFRKLVNAPEFADIGAIEKKFLKSSKDLQDFRDASHRYQEIIAGAWLKAYQRFSDELLDNFQQGEINSEASLQRWLKIADEELVETLRSEDYLKAQQEFFAKGTAYKLKYQEFVEMWCEGHTIPTRSEIDDLHQVIYELRRDVRGLKKELKALKSSTSSAVKKAAPARKKANANTSKKAKAKTTAKSKPSANNSRNRKT